MAKDIFEEEGISQGGNSSPRDIFAEEKIEPTLQPKETRDFSEETLDRILSGLATQGENIYENAAQLGGKIYGQDIGPRQKHDFSSILANIRGKNPQEGLPPQLLEGLVSNSLSAMTPIGRLSGAGLSPILAKILNASVPQATVGAATNENPLLGGALGATTGIIPPASSLTNTTLGKNIAEAFQNARGKYRKEYNSLIKEGMEKGLKKFTLTPELQNMKEEAKFVVDNLPKSRTLFLRNFMENPSLETAHNAQSSLGKLTSSLTNRASRTDLQEALLPISGDLREELRHAIINNFEKGGQTHLAEKYKALTQGYKKEVVPFNQKVMRDYLNGDVSHETLAKKLLRSEKFTLNDASKNIPGVSTRKLLKDNSKLIKLGLLGGLGYEGAHQYGRYSNE